MSTEELASKLKEILDSPNGNAIKVILAYVIKKTSTEVDDNILAHADEMASVIAEELETVHGLNPTTKETIKETFVLLEWLANQTETKWDDRAVNFVKLFVR